MSESELPPDEPAGHFTAIEQFDFTAKQQLMNTLASAPGKLRESVAGLSDADLDTKYRNWTIRQIAHHIADSHLHSLIRFKWALAEDHPTIKAYEEGDWVALADSKRGSIGPSLSLLDGLHEKWIQVLDLMCEEQFARTFLHPQSGESVSLWHALNYYAWHGTHHTAQILWLRSQHQWT